MQREQPASGGSRSRDSRWSALMLPTLGLTGGLGVLGYLRHRFQQSRVFLPGRYPDGIWEPQSFGLPARDVWFRSQDGTELHGWWIPHPKARGTFLYCHGNTGNIAHRIGLFRHLRRLRVHLLAFDYRGYGRSGGTPTETGLYQDVRAAFDHLTEKVGEPPTRIILFGHSLGGAVAVDCARDRPAAGLIVQASFTHVRDAARAMFPTLPIHLAATRQFRNIDKVATIEIPKLFIHGDCDETVPVQLGRRLFEAAAEPKELYIVRRGGHNDLHLHGSVRYLRRIGRFRNRCLKDAARDRRRT